MARRINVPLLFEVTDTGVGIPWPCVPGSSAPSRRRTAPPRGSTGERGLGLSISKRLVEMMGGRIDFESEEGKGSRFWFRVPFELGVAAPSEKPLRKRSTRSQSKRRILVVEDNRINQKVVLKLLDHLGYAADIAQNGKQALAAHAAAPYDLIVMDCQMPEMDGYETTAAIRVLEGSGRRTPIIALTAHALAADRKKCLEAGMDDYLPKPIQLADLGSDGGDMAPGGDEESNRGPWRALTDQEERAQSERRPVFDSAVLEVLASGVRKIRILFRACSGCFSKMRRTAMSRLQTALEKRDREALAAEAHRLKSGCGDSRRAVHARALQETGRARENRLRGGPAGL